MPECYLCGDCIAPGTGYRRKVQTDTSTRIYMTKHGGASYGMRYGLRTLCRTCAMTQDRLENGEWRWFLGLLVAWPISAVLGYNIVVHTDRGLMTIIGLLFVLGFPAFIVIGLLERQRVNTVIDRMSRPGEQVASDCMRSSTPDLSEPDEARLPTESPEAWLDRVLPPFLESETRAACYEYARRSPPRIGQHLMDWIENPPSNVGSPERSAPKILEASFLQSDTIETWAKRAAESISMKTGGSQETIEQQIFSQAQWVLPEPGEPIEDYVKRVQQVLMQLSAKFERYSGLQIETESDDTAKQLGEGLKEWLQRVVPDCCEVESREANDAKVRQLFLIAKHKPPRQGESATDWLERVKIV